MKPSIGRHILHFSCLFLCTSISLIGQWYFENYASQKTAPLTNGEILLFLWLIATVVAIVGIGAFATIKQFSLQAALGILTWIGIGMAFYRYADVNSTIQEVHLNKKTASYKQRVNILVANLTRETFKERPTNLLTIDDIREFQNHLVQWLETADTLQLKSKTAQQLKDIQVQRVKLALAAIEKHPHLIPELDLKRLEDLEENIAEIENNPHSIVVSKPTQITTNMLFELIEWPGLTDEQLRSVASWGNKERYLTQLLLVDFATLNAQKRMTQENPHSPNTEEDALKNLSGQPAVKTLLEDMAIQ